MSNRPFFVFNRLFLHCLYNYIKNIFELKFDVLKSIYDTLFDYNTTSPFTLHKDFTSSSVNFRLQL